jgi:hypothetical protein
VECAAQVSRRSGQAAERGELAVNIGKLGQDTDAVRLDFENDDLVEQPPIEAGI